MTTDRIRKGTLAINRVFYDFVENELLPTVNLTSNTFWRGYPVSTSQTGARTASVIKTRCGPRCCAWPRSLTIRIPPIPCTSV